MSEVDQIVTYSAADCRAKAASKLSEAQALVLAQDAVSAGIALQCAQVWATLALSAPQPEKRDALPLGARLLTADDPEPDARPGDVFVDPSGQGARYLVRLDGHRWGWCDSLAEAEAMPAADTGSWAKSLGCGIIGVRPATERERIEFRNGTGGAALDLVRRLLGTLAQSARDAGHPHIAQWLADCDAKAHLHFHTWLWPAPPSATPNPDFVRMPGQLQKLQEMIAKDTVTDRRAWQLAHDIRELFGWDPPAPGPVYAEQPEADEHEEQCMSRHRGFACTCGQPQ